jgi:hypothetical protein
MLEKLGGLVVVIASAASMIGIKMLELPGVVTFVLVLCAVMLCMGGIVVLFAEEPVFFVRYSARKAVRHGKASETTVS